MPKSSSFPGIRYSGTSLSASRSVASSSHAATRSFISRCSSASRPGSSPDSRSASSAVVTNE